jgi:hypothetical protein
MELDNISPPFKFLLFSKSAHGDRLSLMPKERPHWWIFFLKALSENSNKQISESFAL